MNQAYAIAHTRRLRSDFLVVYTYTHTNRHTAPEFSDTKRDSAAGRQSVLVAVVFVCTFLAHCFNYDAMTWSIWAAWVVQAKSCLSLYMIVLGIGKKQTGENAACGILIGGHTAFSLFIVLSRRCKAYSILEKESLHH